jgi:hypothetical protein
MNNPKPAAEPAERPCDHEFVTGLGDPVRHCLKCDKPEPTERTSPNGLSTHEWEHLQHASRDCGCHLCEKLALRFRHAQGLPEVLREDAAGRPVSELLRTAADMLNQQGGGPVEDCLRLKADEIEALGASI